MSQSNEQKKEEPMDEEQTARYLRIVRKGTMDDMFDFGKEIGRSQTIAEVVEIAEGMKKEPTEKFPLDQRERAYNIALDDLIKKIQEGK